MASKSQIKATNRYNKENTITICFRLNKNTDKDIIEILSKQDNKTGYIKELIRLDYIKDNSID